MIFAKTMRAACASLALSAAFAGLAGADTVITFEGLAEGASVTNQYQADGVVFGPAGSPGVILQFPDYNYVGYPAHSGINVVYSPTTGLIEADASGANFTSAGAWYSTPDSVTLNAYDSSNNLLATSTVGSDYGSSQFFSVSAPNIAYVQFVGDANFYTIDDFTFTTTTVPEPSTMALMGIGAVALVGRRIARRRRGA
jgi:hypothetical protein